MGNKAVGPEDEPRVGQGLQGGVSGGRDTIPTLPPGSFLLMTLHLQGEFAWVEKMGEWMPLESRCWGEYRERGCLLTLRHGIDAHAPNVLDVLGAGE